MGCEPFEELKQRLQKTLDRQRNAETGLAETSAALEKVQKENKQLQAENKRYKNALERIVEIRRCLVMSTRPEHTLMAEEAEQVLKDKE